LTLDTETLAQRLAVGEQDANAFGALARSMVEDLDPRGALETALVEALIAGTWRARVLDAIAAELILPDETHASAAASFYDRSPEVARLASVRDRVSATLARDERLLRARQDRRKRKKRGAK
jgi:hypothetical protein